MKKRFMAVLMIPFAAFMLAATSSFLPAAPVSAAPIDDACEGLQLANPATGACDKAAGDSGFRGIITTIVNVLTVVVGAVSVIMIIIGGIRYTLSNGDSNAMGGAKNTILYAIVGLVIALSAQLIVAFVINKS